MRLRPTVLGTKGLVFGALLLGAYFATPYSNLFFLMLALLVCLGGLAVVSTRRHLRGVQARLRELPAVPAGAPATLEVELDTGGRVCDGLDLVVRAEGLDEVHVPADAARGPCVIALKTPVLQRGVHRFESLHVATSWPFGALLASREGEVQGELVVYPRRGLADDASGAGGGDGLVPTAAHGRGQPAGLREFRDGDELRRVDARASARRGSLVVSEWDEDTGDELHVLLDRRVGGEAFEDALRRLSALAADARERDEGLVVATQGMSSHFGGAGGRPWPELLRWLALVQPSPDGEPPPPAPPDAVRLGASQHGAASGASAPRSRATRRGGASRPRDSRAEERPSLATARESSS